MENKSYCITKKELEEFKERASRIYHIVVVLCYFCNIQPEIEELCTISPILNQLRIESDNLYADLLEFYFQS